MTRTNNIYRKNAGKIIITILLAALAFIVSVPVYLDAGHIILNRKPRLYPIRQSCFRKVQSGFLYQYLEAGSIFKILPQYHYFPKQ